MIAGAHGQRTDRAGRRGAGPALVVALIAALIWTAAPAPSTVHAAPLDYIEVTATCSLSEAIQLANAGAHNSPGNPQGGPTNDCPDHALGTTTIRITANSGTVTHPSSGASSAGVGLSSTFREGSFVGGTTSILPSITGNNILIEGDPDHPDPQYGYSISAIAPLQVQCVILPNGQPSAGCLLTPPPSSGARILDVAAGASLTIRNLNLGGGEIVANGDLVEAAGGAVYALGALTLDHVTVLDNRVTGGSRAAGTGGGVYAAAALTVTSSVFENNVTNGGTRGGGALGGAIGLGPNAVATISDSVFLTNEAHGGGGDPGSWGRNGKDGFNGRDGYCDEQDQDKAAGQDGGEGGNGVPGGYGDPGGDAVGAVAGGASISIDHSSFVGNVAVAGAAGVGGFGGNGGKGGDAGRGRNCTVDQPTEGAASPWETWSGDGGDGGLGGNDGSNGLAGERGTAVATVSAGADGGNADTDIRLVDVTVSGGSATVPDDNYGRYHPDDWDARRTQTLAPAGGSGGAPGGADNGNRGKVGTGGFWDQTFLGRESLVDLGEVAAVGATGQQVAVSASTIVGVELSTAKVVNYRADATTPTALTNASGDVKGSIVWTTSAAPCPSLRSRGYNVFAASNCQGSLGPTADDRVESLRPVDATETDIGNVIRPANRAGQPYRMPMLPIRQGSQARNRAPQGSPGVSGPCAALGTVGPLADDGRRLARTDGACDAGAYEEDVVFPIVTLQGPAVLYRSAGPGQIVVRVPNPPGAGTTLVVGVRGIDGVEFPAGFQPTPNDADAAYSEASLDLDSVVFPIGRGFLIDAPAAPTDTVVVTAHVDGTQNGTVTATPLDIPVRHDGQLDVAIDAPSTWSPCLGYLPITYTAGSIGHSPAPAATIRVWPSIVRPTIANGLPTPPGETATSTPLVYPSVGSTAIVQLDGSVLWSTPAIRAGDPPPTLRVYVAVGQPDLTQAVYLPGMKVRAQAAITYVPPAPNDTFKTVIPDIKDVLIVNDLDLLGGSLTRTAGVADPDVSVKAGTTGTLYAKIEPDVCGAADQPHDWGTVTLTVRDPAAADPTAPILGPIGTRNLVDRDTGNAWFPVTFTAPMGSGPHHLEFEYRGIGSDPVTILVPYDVDPVGLSILDAGSASESSATRTFTVQLEHAVGAPVTANWKLAAGTARIPADVGAQSGTVTIPAGATTAAFSVAVVDDTTPEPDERFFATISPITQNPLPAGVQIVRSFGAADLLNDDVALTVADASVTEGDTGTTDMTFTLSSPLPNPRECSVRVATVLDGTASASDLTAVDQEVVVSAGSTAVVVPLQVAVVGDTIAERNETFHLAVTPTAGSTGTPCGVLAASALGRIVDDDVATISIADTSVGEGSGAATFTISLATTADHAVTVHAATAPGTAGAGDFTATAADVTIPAGATSATFTVAVVDDANVEPDETFTVTLSAATGAPLGTATAVATIVDDDVPAVTVGNVTVTEGSGGGTTTATVPVTLSEPSPHPIVVTIHVGTCAGSPADVTVTIPAGSTSADAAIPVGADEMPEGDVTCPVTVIAVDGSPPGGTSGSVTIVDDDAFVLDGGPVVQVTEGARTARVTIALNAPAPAGGIAFDYRTVDGTATAPGDYLPASGVGTIPAGATSIGVEIVIVDDRTYEDGESFTVSLANPRPAGSTVARLESVAGSPEAVLTVAAPATVTILDDDPAAVAAPTPAGVDPSNAPSGELPITGTDLAGIVVLAAAVVGAGLVLRRVRRRRPMAR